MKREALNALAAVAAVVLLVAGGPWVAAVIRSLPARPALAARASQRVVTLEISGMTCSVCAAHIQGQLSSTPGVSACEVRVPQARAYVVCDRATPDSALVGAVHRAGPGYLADVVAR